VQNYNLVHSWKNVSDASPGSSEPVTRTEMKNYMRISAFTDDNDSTSVDEFTEDDDLIDELIISAREGVEEFTGLALVPKEMRVVLTNLAGMSELPFSPIAEISEVLYKDDEEDAEDPDYINRFTEEPTSFKIYGQEVKNVHCPRQELMTFQYTCGYGTDGVSAMPKRLKEAIIKEVLYRYEHRGDELTDTGICKAARILARPFRRLTWLA
jgi:uncharacterized phiE125 gp8 family phage protein